MANNGSAAVLAREAALTSGESTQTSNEIERMSLVTKNSQFRIAYLTTEYPKVSHTFIRREIIELEKLGFLIDRFSIRGAAPIADLKDQEEEQKTFHCLSQSIFSFLFSFIATLFARPKPFLLGLFKAGQMGLRSERGVLRHIAYLFEAMLLLSVFSKRSINHIHVHFGTNAATVAFLIRELGGPSYSMTVHGPDEFDAPRGFCLKEKVEKAVFTIAISEFCRAQIQRWVDPSAWERIHIVRCTVGEEFFVDTDSNEPVEGSFLSVGRLSAQKGQMTLIQAFKALRDEGLDARLVLAGDGELRNKLEETIHALGLEGAVTITGWVDEAEVRKQLQRARVLVQPSFAEGLPLVLMEALAMKRPVISTYVAGIPELVRPGKNGWLVPSGSVEELKDAMRDAFRTSNEALSAMGIAGSMRVRQNHHVETEVAKLGKLFATLPVSS